MNQGREMPRQHSYQASHEYQGQAPGITIHHTGPTNNSGQGSGLPGVLQSGRPSAPSSITAPSTVPTLPPLQTPYQPNSSSRPTTANHAHNYTRSSPAGFDQQKYTPFGGTPENNRYASTPNHKYNASQGGQGDNMYSPLALTDVRTFDESALADPTSANPYADGYSSVPTRSNYLAPWPVYAFDWCKWPVQNQQLGDSAGKMAIGSYVEDGHNFVSDKIEQLLEID